MDRQLRNEVFDILEEIEKIHSGIDSNIINETTELEQKVLDGMKALIEEYGHHDLFLYRAALSACNNWSTFRLVRESFFSMDLEEGIRSYGCLAPDRELDWAVLQTVAEANPDMYFIEDMEGLYDIICNAIEKADDDIPYMATVVRDIIWEPENPIDED